MECAWAEGEWGEFYIVPVKYYNFIIMYCAPRHKYVYAKKLYAMHVKVI